MKPSPAEQLPTNIDRLWAAQVAEIIFLMCGMFMVGFLVGLAVPQ